MCLDSRVQSIHRSCRMAVFIFFGALFASALCQAQNGSVQNNEADVLVLTNGDTLHGNLVDAIGGTVTFHSEPAGNITIHWDKIRMLRTSGAFAVLNSNSTLRSRRNQGAIGAGKLIMQNGTVILYPTGAPPLAPIPIAQAQYVVPVATLEKQATTRPSLLTGWDGQATAGATLVTATQNQYTVSGGISLVRSVPEVRWLATRNRTSLGFNGSFGKITQPSYFDPTTGTVVGAISTKTAIFHAEAERDQYFTTRFFALAMTSFDHNFSQNLDLQQIYGAGIGWTALKTPRQEAHLKATLQYEKQQFISGGGSANQNLIGSTLSADYSADLGLLHYAQTVAFIPAFNNPHAYSASESNTLAFPAYRNLSFSVGTLDSYLNNPPSTLPPTRRNSFQFTMGLTFAIKSKY